MNRQSKVLLNKRKKVLTHISFSRTTRSTRHELIEPQAINKVSSHDGGKLLLSDMMRILFMSMELLDLCSFFRYALYSNRCLF